MKKPRAGFARCAAPTGKGPRRWGLVVLLADELFCVAHDDRTGRSRLSPRVLGLGLAAALLGELVLFGRLEVDGARVVVLPGDPPLDALAHTTLTQVVAQPQHREVRTWLAFLADSAADAVAGRLVLDGVWSRQEFRRFGRRRVVGGPVDATEVAWRAMRLGNLLTSGSAVSQSDAMLAGLVQVCGLLNDVLWQPEVRDFGRSRLSRVIDGLCWPLYHLLAFTEAAVGDAALVPR